MKHNNQTNKQNKQFNIILTLRLILLILLSPSNAYTF